MSEVKKALIRNAKANGVRFFDVRGTIDEMPDKTLRDQLIADCLADHELAPCPPFSVMNPSHIKTSPKSRRLGRNYPWGFADCLDPHNSDFARLHKLLLVHLRGELTATAE